ncbi:hypothetical protein GCM10022402_12430 [Salinactinospora qingdaonensis]|uniref:Uncharacterized protein n=1 Tax=Salinactinospora qingdaonensis TaxID=702744 RepID=A0ABP7F869_9ACTN
MLDIRATEDVEFAGSPPRLGGEPANVCYPVPRSSLDAAAPGAVHERAINYKRVVIPGSYQAGITGTQKRSKRVRTRRQN